MFSPDPVRLLAPKREGVTLLAVQRWELRVIVFRWGHLSELEESYSRAGEQMSWKGQPEVLLGKCLKGPYEGQWEVPWVDERDEDGEREAVSLALLKQTGLPLNPTRFVEVSAECEDQVRRVTFAVCITNDESLAARQGPWPREPPQRELKWFEKDSVPRNSCSQELVWMLEEAWKHVATEVHEERPPEVKPKTERESAETDEPHTINDTAQTFKATYATPTPRRGPIKQQ